MKFRIKQNKILEYNDVENNIYPKYTTQIMNLANQNAQGTRPKVVGQLSELFPEFLKSERNISLDTWKEWYTNRFPNGVHNATDRICEQINNLQEAINFIDRDMVESWVEDLVINKTYTGLYVQKTILKYFSELENKPYRLANPDEEAIGIDGYVGNIPYSIKPITYKEIEMRLPEEINVRMIYYEKKQNDLEIYVED